MPRDFWEVIGTFDAAAGQYTGRWFDEKFARPDKDGDDQLKPERVWEKDKAEAIRDKCLGKPGIVTEESKPSTSLSPLLYDLTSLQRDANSRFGFSAKNTLGLAQALYERHKVLTYPRTDSRALPEDYIGTVKNTLEMLGRHRLRDRLPTQILKNDWVHPNKRIFNNAKVSDHFAIIPTTLAPQAFERAGAEALRPGDEAVPRDFLSGGGISGDHAHHARRRRAVQERGQGAGETRLAGGLWQGSAESDDTPNLAPVKPNETVKTSAVEVKPNVTKPPPRYTEATLLCAMEGAGKLVEDEELREAMSEKGLGTPATRAAIIEGLIYEDYVHRNGRELQATAKAFSLMELLNGLGIPELTKPELTGDWEFKLHQIQRRQKSRDEFMSEIADMTRHIVERAKKYEHDTIPGDFGVLKMPCPKCGGEIHEKYKQFQCVKCDFAIWKTLCSRMFEIGGSRETHHRKADRAVARFPQQAGHSVRRRAEVERRSSRLNLISATTRRTRTARPPRRWISPARNRWANVPKCGARVFDAGMNYVCEKATGADKTCTFRSGKIILQQDDRAGADAETAGRRQDRFAQGIHFQENQPQVRGVPGASRTAGRRLNFRRANARRRSKDAKPKEPLPKIDFTGKEPLGKCPKCGGKVFDTDAGYLCEKSQADKKPCKFKINKEILQQPIEPAQAQKLLTARKTDLLDKFISKAGKPFPAYLVMDDKGKVTFEFPGARLTWERRRKVAAYNRRIIL